MAVALVLEHCFCDLRRLLELLGQGAALEPALAKAVMRQLLAALQACHQAGGWPCRQGGWRGQGHGR